MQDPVVYSPCARAGQACCFPMEAYCLTAAAIVAGTDDTIEQWLSPVLQRVYVIRVRAARAWAGKVLPVARYSKRFGNWVYY